LGEFALSEPKSLSPVVEILACFGGIYRIAELMIHVVRAISLIVV
jgi:hypothetical protein